MANDEQDRMYVLQAEICRALGHPRRLELLDLLAGGEMAVAELLRELGISKGNLSQHLAVMKPLGLVESRREGREVYLRLAFPEVTDACGMVRGVLARRLLEESRLARELTAARKREPGGKKGKQR